jgi:hypothetical protein
MPRRRVVLRVIGVMWLLSSQAAALARDTSPPMAADSERAPPAESPPSARVWYGWQILIVDGVAIGTLVASRAFDSPGLLATGAGLWLFGGAILHFSHSQTDAGFGSFGMRALSAGVLTLGIALYAPHLFDGENSGEEALILGGLLGMIASMAIDAALLAFMPRRGARARSWVIPFIQARERNVGVRIGIAF